MYNIIIEYGLFYDDDSFRHAVKLTKIINKLTDNKIFKSLEDAKEMLDIIKNNILNERKEGKVSYSFLKFDGGSSIKIINTDELFMSINIKEIKNTYNNIEREENIICTLDDIIDNNVFIDIHVPFIMNINGVNYDILSVKYLNNKLFYTYALDTNGEPIHATEIVRDYNKNIIFKDDILEPYKYIYNEIMKIIVNETL